MTDADIELMNTQHFGSDPADIQMRIRINPEIRIRIPNHVWLTFWRWRRLRYVSTVEFKYTSTSYK